MKLAVFAYSRQGCRTAGRVMAALPEAEWSAHTARRLAGEGFSPIPHPSAAFYGEQFHWADALVFVGACGIAVRQIAPYVSDKGSDPAVVCVDELGRFVIPLLSGHLGGANALALRLAASLGATPVITTATDIRGQFSVDAWAGQNGFAIGNLSCAKTVSAAILERDIPLSSDFPILGDYPRGTVPGDTGELGIYLSWRKRAPFAQTLRLIPKVLRLGLGCRKGVSAEQLQDAVERVLEQREIDIRAVREAASIDLKKGEPGLLQFCERNGWPLRFYSAGELEAVPGEFTPSRFVQSVTGVDNVCERAALLGANRLIVRKTALNGVTVAVGLEKLEVCFGENHGRGYRPG